MPLEVRAFLRESSAHGLRYLVDGRGPLERAAWAVVLAAAISYAGISISRCTLHNESTNYFSYIYFQ